jgi:hypothetical protein
MAWYLTDQAHGQIYLYIMRDTKIIIFWNLKHRNNLLCTNQASVLVAWIALVFLIKDGPVSELYPKTDYFPEVFIGSLQCLQENTGSLTKISERSPYSTISLSACLSIYIWLYSPCEPWPLFQLLNLFTVGWTPWTGNQPVARPLPNTNIE